MSNPNFHYKVTDVETQEKVTIDVPKEPFRVNLSNGTVFTFPGPCRVKGINHAGDATGGTLDVFDAVAVGGSTGATVCAPRITIPNGALPNFYPLDEACRNGVTITASAALNGELLVEGNYTENRDINPFGVGQTVYDGTTAAAAVSGAGSTQSSTSDPQYLLPGSRAARRITNTTSNLQVNADFTLQETIKADDNFDVLMVDLFMLQGGNTSLTSKDLTVRIQNVGGTILRTHNTYVASASGLGCRNGRNRLIFAYEGWDAGGGSNARTDATWIESVQIRAGAQAGISTDFIVNNISFNPRSGRVPVAQFHFDDCWRSNFLFLLPLMREYGIPVSFAVATDFVDRNSGEYMTWAELRSIKEEFGDQVCFMNHTRRHLGASTLEGFTQAQFDQELADAEARLIAEGIWDASTEKHLVTPQGAWSANIVAATRARGYVTLRGVRPGSHMWDIGNPDQKFDSQYDLRVFNLAGTLSTPVTAGYNPCINLLMKTGGNGIFLLHATNPNDSGVGSFDGAAASLNVTQNQMEAMFADARARMDAGLLRVLTQEQFAKEAELVAC